MSYSEIEHFATMLSGCESITAGGTLTPDGHYASSVLKLHAQDAGFIAGQEGFLDSIKKGARSAMKWIKELVKAIAGFFRKRKPGFNEEEQKDKKAKEEWKTFKNSAEYKEIEERSVAEGKEMYSNFCKSVTEQYVGPVIKTLVSKLNAFGDDMFDTIKEEAQKSILKTSPSEMTKGLEKAYEEALKEGPKPVSQVISRFEREVKDAIFYIEWDLKKVPDDKQPTPGLIAAVKWSGILAEGIERFTQAYDKYNKKQMEFLLNPGDYQP